MKKIIYLVEDDDALSESLEILLNDEGYIVKTFTKGRILQRSIHQRLPNLIIMDHHLSDEDGILLAHEIRNNPAAMRIPIILMSATQADLQDKAKDIGAAAYFRKPFNIDDFLRTVQWTMR